MAETHVWLLLVLLLLYQLHLLILLKLELLMLHQLMLDLLLHDHLLLLQLFSDLFVIGSILLLLQVLLMHYYLLLFIFIFSVLVLRVGFFLLVDQLGESALLIELLHHLVDVCLEAVFVKVVVEVLTYNLVLLHLQIMCHLCLVYILDLHVRRIVCHYILLLLCLLVISL